jgi:hypothetical protein
MRAIAPTRRVPIVLRACLFTASPPRCASSVVAGYAGRRMRTSLRVRVPHAKGMHAVRHPAPTVGYLREPAARRRARIACRALPVRRPMIGSPTARHVRSADTDRIIQAARARADRMRRDDDVSRPRSREFVVPGTIDMLRLADGLAGRDDAGRACAASRAERS